MPKPLPAISLVIPAYNRADLIVETIDSALTQTLPFQEIIIVDDGSNDHTPEVLAGYGDKITIIRTPNRGVQAARNTGIAVTTTELVAFCDSDDLLEPTLCETIVTWLSNHLDIDACFCNFTTFDQESTYPDKFSLAPAGYFEGATLFDKNFLVDIPSLYQRMLTFQPLFQSGLIVKKAFFNTIGDYDLRFNGIGAEDWEFTLRAVASGKIALCSLPLARVRRHPGNDSGNAMRMNLGEAEILEFGLMHHQGATRYRAEIQNTINQRRVLAFDAAFALGDFKLAKQILSKITVAPPSPKFLLKQTITALPAIVRQPLWKLSQR